MDGRMDGQMDGRCTILPYRSPQRVGRSVFRSVGRAAPRKTADSRPASRQTERPNGGTAQRRHGEGADAVTDQVPEQPAGDRRIDWPSTLDSVVVHASGAVCRRRAHGVLPPDATSAADARAAGSQLRLRLTGLPRVLDGRSLRAGVLDGAPGWRVTEVRPAVAARLRRTEELPDLRRRRDEVAQRQASLSELQGLVERRITQTADLRAVEPPRNPEDPHRRTPADAFLALADFVDERLTALHARAEELRGQLEQVTHELSLLDDQLDRGSNAEPATPVETSAVALVTLTRGPAAEPPDPSHEQPHPQELTLELEYLVPGALWVPSYRLSHRRGDGGGTLLLRAEVAQRTGEDWTDVRLGFSTADLHRSCDLPRLRSIRIGRSQPALPPSGWREPPAGLGELFAGYDRAEPPADYGLSGGADRPLPRRSPTAPPPRARRAVRLPLRAAARRRACRLGGPAARGPPGHARHAGQDRDARAAAQQRPGRRLRRRPPGAPAPAAAPAADLAPTAPAPPAGPAADLLDYAALTLAGPAEPPARRGRLHPGAQPDSPPTASPPPGAPTTRRRATAPSRWPTHSRYPRTPSTPGTPRAPSTTATTHRPAPTCPPTAGGTP